MGNAKSTENVDLEYKIKEKELNREYKKCVADQAKEAENVKNALIKGDKNLAKIHAKNILRKKSQAAHILELISNFDEIRTNNKLRSYSKSSGSTGYNKFSYENLSGRYFFLRKVRKKFLKCGDTSFNAIKTPSPDMTILRRNFFDCHDEEVDDDKVDELISKIALESDMDLESYLKVVKEQG